MIPSDLVAFSIGTYLCTPTAYDVRPTLDHPMGPMGLEERAHPSGSQRIQSLHCESSLSGKAHFERCSQPGDDGRDEQFPQLRTVVTRLNTSGMGM